ncbi:hypothetical protein GUJ93_ZPchr0001g30537 [Zizania palustris]|uniref:Uncharacterized protein n=1 Tax=Zizania palustris TaxID=103762 RepID=A0A8J5SAG7_ZIZPA|nr:hypothetical protein GUJ93_ZPchr0001g30537 [Zizania palustris]
MDDPVRTNEEDSNHDNLSVMSNISDGHLTNPAAAGMGEEKPQLPTNTESHQNQIRLLATSRDVVGGSNDGSSSTMTTPAMAIASAHQIRLPTASSKIASPENRRDMAANEAGQGYKQGQSVQEAKKRRMVWTDELHSRFLQAYEFLNNTQGLTRKNVASHLQKHQIRLPVTASVHQIIQPTASSNDSESNDNSMTTIQSPDNGDSLTRESACGAQKNTSDDEFQMMNEPGLTRENVASHLQKHQIRLLATASVHQIRQPTTSSNDSENNDDSMTTTQTMEIASPENQRDMAANKAGQGYEQGQSVQGPKKRRMVWTDELHNRFLQAYEFLNSTQGLTRKNVASHIQKHQIRLPVTASVHQIIQLTASSNDSESNDNSMTTIQSPDNGDSLTRESA